ncbi:hypothetical protein [Vibrio sp. WXL103]|uniref:hypothetical protein n=1 Tax=Vibrio sp. WXL103 TaxID=3450710 RepID=UPI003EC8ABAF
MITWVLILTSYTLNFEISQIEHISDFTSQQSCEVAGKDWQKGVSQRNGLELRTHYLCVKK